MKTLAVGSFCAVLVLGTPLLPLFAQANPSNQMATPPATGMMQSCEHHKAMEAALTAIEKIVNDNKSSKDVPQLQAALNQVSSQVAVMQESSKKCAGMMNMMNMMEKMKSAPKPGDAEHKH